MSDSIPTVCPHCGSTRIAERPKDYIDVGVGPGIKCEAEIYCGSCLKELGYWAYGSYLPDEEHPEGFDFMKLTGGEMRNLLKDMKDQHGIETLGQLKEARERGRLKQNTAWGSW